MDKFLEEVLHLPPVYWEYFQTYTFWSNDKNVFNLWVNLAVLSMPFVFLGSFFSCMLDEERLRQAGKSTILFCGFFLGLAILVIYGVTHAYHMLTAGLSHM